MPKRIDDLYLNCFERNGLLLDMRPLAERIRSEGQKRPYFFVPNIHQSFKMVSAGEQPYNPTRRAEIARPAVLGTFKHLDGDGPALSHEALIVKESGSWHVGLPACLDTFFPAAKAVAEDVLSLYGAKNFCNAQIGLFTERKPISPLESANPHVNYIHNHTESYEKTLDLLYAVSNCLPTLFENAAQQGLVPTIESSLTRFGSEENHCPAVNNTSETLRRTFGIFLVHPERYLYNKGPYNAAFNSGKKDKFEQAATAYLQSEKNTLTIYPEPVPLRG